MSLTFTTSEGNLLRVSFQHQQSTSEEPKYYRLPETGTVVGPVSLTQCVITVVDPSHPRDRPRIVFGDGLAVCRLDLGDTFNKEIGRRSALRKALATFSREDRIGAWERYWETKG